MRAIQAPAPRTCPPDREAPRVPGEKSASQDPTYRATQSGGAAPGFPAHWGAAPFGFKGAGFRPRGASEARAARKAAALHLNLWRPRPASSCCGSAWRPAQSALLLATLPTSFAENVAWCRCSGCCCWRFTCSRSRLCFESDRRQYSRRWFHPAFALGTFLICFVLLPARPKIYPRRLPFTRSGLFARLCMVCHGELARLAPDPQHLRTLFYLIVAAGGVLGGLFVALAAPYLFVGYWEYEVSLWLAALLFLVVLYRDRGSWLHSTRVPAAFVLIGAAALLPVSMALAVRLDATGRQHSCRCAFGQRGRALLPGSAKANAAKPRVPGGSPPRYQASVLVLDGGDSPLAADPLGELGTSAARGTRAAEAAVAPGSSPALSAAAPADSKTRTLNPEGCGTQPENHRGGPKRRLPPLQRRAPVRHSPPPRPHIRKPAPLNPKGAAPNPKPPRRPKRLLPPLQRRALARHSSPMLRSRPKRVRQLGGRGFSPDITPALSRGLQALKPLRPRHRMDLLAQRCPPRPPRVPLPANSRCWPVAPSFWLVPGRHADHRRQSHARADRLGAQFLWRADHREHQFPTERDREAYALKHGEIFHGFEFRAPQRHLVPTSYFSEDSGLGLLLAPHLQRSSGSAARGACSRSAGNGVVQGPGFLRIGRHPAGAPG